MICMWTLVHCTMHKSPSILWYYGMYNVPPNSMICTRYTVQESLYSMICKMYNVLPNSMICTMYNVPPNSMICTMYNVHFYDLISWNLISGPLPVTRN